MVVSPRPSHICDGHDEVPVEDRGIQIRAADGDGDPRTDGHQAARHEGCPEWSGWSGPFKGNNLLGRLAIGRCENVKFTRN